MKTIALNVKRQLDPESKPYWEDFEIPWKPNMNVTSCLMEIALNPCTKDGKASKPVTYDSNCLEEVCGSGTVVINGKARRACSALVDKLDQPIRLEPLSKF